MTKRTYINQNEKRLIIGVFQDLLGRQYPTAKNWLGSITEQEMRKLLHRLTYEDYMKEHGIKRIEDMTDDDYINYYEEKETERERESEESDDYSDY